MDIVYASLYRRQPGLVPPGEKAEVLAALWAHAQPADGLQHASARCEDDRVDLLLYLLARPADTDPCPAVAQTRTLIARVHQASPLLSRRFLPPHPPGH
ncbi:hypothetical protein ACIRBX_00145 [Kitasatospora sp. NPDC096147]|uniref:hypothetical protein n=1 Tax=Kitasatospora sp. NPDC096147 TaxID=3364093 RepID=UPI0037F56D72